LGSKSRFGAEHGVQREVGDVEDGEHARRGEVVSRKPNGLIQKPGSQGTDRSLRIFDSLWV
jgi:hypothetical protein